MNFSPDSLEGEDWKNIPQFDGCYSISNYGRIWAAARPINAVTGQTYHTKERIRKQYLDKYYNTYTKDYTEQLFINLRYEHRNYRFKVSRLVYEHFVGPLGSEEGNLRVVHKDGDNCNNRYDNLVLMNGTELYGHRLSMKRIPRTGQIIKRSATPSSYTNAPRPVVQYSLDGKKLNEYDSLLEAAQANNVHRTSIRQVIQQKLVQLHGLVYRFKDTPYRGEHAGFSIEKKVTQYELGGKKVKAYPSVRVAADRMGLDPNFISKCALKKKMTYSGFVWRYEGDPYKGEYKNKIKNDPREIIQYSLEGKKIAGFESVNEAARQTGFSSATLLDCAFKRSKVAHGFVWRFKNEPYSGEHKLYRRGKPVTQYSLEGKKISTYPTIETAARATGLPPDNIQKNVNGFNKTAGGFVWKPATDEEILKIPFIPGIREYLQLATEHKKNARRSTKGKHEKGQTRKAQDRDGGKGTKNFPRKRPPGWKGPWPPRK